MLILKEFEVKDSDFDKVGPWYKPKGEFRNKFSIPGNVYFWQKRVMGRTGLMLPEALKYMMGIIGRFPYPVLVTSTFRTTTGGTGRTSHSRGMAIDLQYLDPSTMRVMDGETSAACIVYDILRLEGEVPVGSTHNVEFNYKGRKTAKSITIAGSRPEVHANVRPKGPTDMTWNKNFHMHWDLNGKRGPIVGINGNEFTLVRKMQIDKTDSKGNYTRFTSNHETYYNNGVK